MSIKKHGPTEVRSVCYAITHTIPPLLCKMNPDLVQYDLLFSELNEIKLMDARITFITEYTKCGNLHFHGIINFELPKRGSCMNRYKQHFKDKRLSKYFGYMEMKQIDDYDGWLNYIIKDLQLTYDKLEHQRYPVVRDDFGIFDGTKWSINPLMRMLIPDD